jgi:hypothetical protein
MFKVGRSGFYGRAKTGIDQNSITIVAGDRKHRLFLTGGVLISTYNSISKALLRAANGLEWQESTQLGGLSCVNVMPTDKSGLSRTLG